MVSDCIWQGGAGPGKMFRELFRLELAAMGMAVLLPPAGMGDEAMYPQVMLPQRTDDDRLIQGPRQ